VAYTCWNIWLERNTTTFEGNKPSISSIVITSLSNYHKSVVKHKNPHTRPCLNEDISEYSVAFFDGAAQEDGRYCGAGGIIKLSESTTFKWFVNYGAGTNTKDELIGAWATLHIEKYLSIQKLQVLGYSSVIINWLNKKGNLMVSALEGWKQRIIILKGKFVETNFYHIFRNFNMLRMNKSTK
jgi:ribonuclease HI